MYVAVTKELSRNERIRRAHDRFKRLLKNIRPDRLRVADGLLSRLAFMQVMLEDLEATANQNGLVDRIPLDDDTDYKVLVENEDLEADFDPDGTADRPDGIECDQQPPAIRIYNATIKNYAGGCKQLLDLLLDEDSESALATELMEYVKRPAEEAGG